MSRFERIAENERKIREVNEEAELVAADEDLPAGTSEDTEIEFLCACGRETCDETLLLTLAEYAGVHKEPHRFIIAHGHETPGVERVVETHPTYLVVEKAPSYRESSAD
jgi:hypothetical protein